ncbi:MAG: formate dehydrogenase accessory sulfurtransferase FdhD [Calditrichaeota bacterium]|nr:MAG: formate dehydrogenase accessory sulfurtransferase FdhD [Calditrichota bacterium]
MMDISVTRFPITAVERGNWVRRQDEVAVEEPLEIRVAVAGDGWSRYHPLAVTMRTPGHDFELAAGFLFSEGIVRRKEDIQHLAYCRDGGNPDQENIVVVELSPGVSFDPERLSRRVYTSASCGICGRTSLEMVWKECGEKPVGRFRLSPEMLYRLPEALYDSQRLFACTGGLHAAALFDASGRLLRVREDVGRHNALDKLIGALLLEGGVPASEVVVLVSGRAGFELVQKAVLAGIPALAAIGAPSSLAIELAREYGITLVGFVREERFNVYAGEERVAL